MENTGKRNTQEIQIQGLLDRYLNRKSATSGLSTQQSHLDEDYLTAFIEGNLSEREAKPIVSHLVDCSFCRHVTAELVRLDFAFADEEVPSAVQQSQPSKISEVLSSLLAKIFGTGDSAVFAHQESEEKPETETEEDKPEDK
ncbi:MAG TPA: hypothetical protein VGC97_17170 [Pyrinomonadaceae bacterium]|jgi:hypothetical protein